MPTLRQSRSRSRQKASEILRLMKPGPATAPSTTSGLAFRRASSGSAMSRGFFFAALASTMAALVAMSPCAASRGGSAVTAEKSSPDGNSPAACMAFSAASISPMKWR
jgi:hypothetical protein